MADKGLVWLCKVTDGCYRDSLIPSKPPLGNPFRQVVKTVGEGGGKTEIAVVCRSHSYLDQVRILCELAQQDRDGTGCHLSIEQVGPAGLLPQLDGRDVAAPESRLGIHQVLTEGQACTERRTVFMRSNISSGAIGVVYLSWAAY
jgi:hypothetical protein